MATLREARRRRVLQLRSRTAVVNVLRFFWVFAVLWCELGVFFWSVAACRWPNWQDRPPSQGLHVLLVADPQVPRPYKGWPLSLSWFKQYVVNLNLRKSWNAVKTLRPQVIIFLGDMLRQGSIIKDIAEYGDYYAQFRATFSINPAISTYYIPGNRDVGLGSSRTFSAHARKLFKTYFGPVNQLVQVGNHTLILLDAPGLVEEDYRRYGAQLDFADWLGIPGGSIEFVNSVATKPRDHPVVLFTHIPLFRPESASCGPLRERGNIRRGVGRGYQSLLGRETSNFVLERTLPAVTFSADDHDYCEYLHTLPTQDVGQYPVREVTVKSFSMATRINRPGFQLLSLFAPEGQQPDAAYADVPCLLPNQTRIYTHGYGPLIFLTIALLLFLNVRRHRPPPLDGSHPWHDPVALQTHDSESADTSPGAPSPPASPIPFKSSHSHPPALRSASTLTPNMLPSRPTTPLGGTPLFSSSFRPPAEDDDGQELLHWPSQNATPKASPLLPQVGAHEADSSYFLPTPGVRKIGTSRRSIWLPSFGARTRLTVQPSYVSALSLPVVLAARVLGLGGHRRARTRFGRFVQDAMHVASLPVLVYVGISLWLFR